MVGRDNIRFTDRAVDSGARKTFLMRELRFPADGRVTSFWMYAVRNGHVQLQVWRPEGDSAATNFTLVGGNDITVTNAPGYIEVRFFACSCKLNISATVKCFENINVSITIKSFKQ